MLNKHTIQNSHNDYTSAFQIILQRLGLWETPSSFENSLSWYQSIKYVLQYLLDKVIPPMEENDEKLNELISYYEEVVDYCNDYFDNLDVQEEINNKLDSMAQSGELTNLIKFYVDPFIDEQNEEIENFKNAVANQLNLQNTKIESLESGSPLAASSTAGMTDTTRVYVNTTDGHWYYYDGSDWTDGGTYQAAEDSQTVNQLKTDVKEDKSNIKYLYNGVFNDTELPSQLDVTSGLQNYTTPVYAMYKLYILNNITADLIKARIFFKFIAEEIGNSHSVAFRIYDNTFTTLLYEKCVDITAEENEQYYELDIKNINLKSANGVWIGYEELNNNKHFLAGKQYQNAQINNIYINNSAVKYRSGSSFVTSEDGNNSGGYFVKVHFFTNENKIENVEDRIEDLENTLYSKERDSSLRILLVSDIHINLEDYRYEDYVYDEDGRNVNIPDDDRMELLVNAINKENAELPIDFIIVNGDLCSLKNGDDKVAIYNKFKNYMNKCDVPYVSLIGNHDSFSNAEWLEIMGQESNFTIYTDDYAFICVNMYIDPETGLFPSYSSNLYVGIDNNDTVKTWVYNEIDKAKANNKKIFMVWHDFQENVDSEFKAYMDNESAILGDIAGHSHIQFQYMQQNGKVRIGTGNFGYLLYNPNTSENSRLNSKYSFKILEIRDNALRCKTIFPACTYHNFMGGIEQAYTVSNDLVIEQTTKIERPTFTVQNFRNMKYKQIMDAIENIDNRLKQVEEIEGE